MPNDKNAKCSLALLHDVSTDRQLEKFVPGMLRSRRYAEWALRGAAERQFGSSPRYSSRDAMTAHRLRKMRCYYLRILKRPNGWSDAQLNGTVPHIRVSLGLVNGDLTATAVEILQLHREAQKGQRNGLGLVFPNASGGFMDNRNFTQRVLRPLLESAELPKIGLHGLRHCGNSLPASSGVSLKTLQARPGHSTSRTTLDVHSHGYASDGKQAAIVMESLLDSGLKVGLNAPASKSSGGATVMKKPLRRKGSSSKPTAGLEPATYCLRNEKKRLRQRKKPIK